MKQNIHFYYDQLTSDEKEFVDMNIKRIFSSAQHFINWKIPLPLNGDDTCERFANSFALWIIDSRKKSLIIEECTPLLPFLIADNVIAEVQSIIGPLPNPDEYNRKLCSKAQYVFEHNINFRNKISKPRGNKGRDRLYSFMRHWIAAILKDNNYSLYKKLPSGFGFNC